MTDSDRALDYYFGAYLHEDWSDECGSNRIQDSLDFFFRNECGADAESRARLASRLIKEIDATLVADDEKVKTQVAWANYWLPTIAEARAWLQQIREWCMAQTTR